MPDGIFDRIAGRHWEPIPPNGFDRAGREERQTKREKACKLSAEKGLYLIVTPSGSKLGRFDYRFGDKRKTLALGKWDGVEMAEAIE